jgi:hypothetical protein
MNRFMKTKTNSWNERRLIDARCEHDLAKTVAEIRQKYGEEYADLALSVMSGIEMALIGICKANNLDLWTGWKAYMFMQAQMCRGAFKCAADLVAEKRKHN